jgi:hypothetical protein
MNLTQRYQYFRNELKRVESELQLHRDSKHPGRDGWFYTEHMQAVRNNRDSYLRLCNELAVSYKLHIEYLKTFTQIKFNNMDEAIKLIFDHGSIDLLIVSYGRYLYLNGKVKYVRELKGNTPLVFPQGSGDRQISNATWCRYFQENDQPKVRVSSYGVNDEPDKSGLKRRVKVES